MHYELINCIKSLLIEEGDSARKFLITYILAFVSLIRSVLLDDLFISAYKKAIEMIKWKVLSNVQHPQSEWYTYDPIPRAFKDIKRVRVGGLVNRMKRGWGFELLIGDARSQTEKREKQPRNGSQAQ